MTKRCLTCDNMFHATMAGLLGDFCKECRDGFHIKSERDAEELADMIDVGIVARSDRLPTKEITAMVPSKPKVDPVAVAAGIRAQVDYVIAPAKALKKPITYVCHKNGLFEYRHSELATVVTKAKEVLGITEEGKEGITFNLPKLPFLFLQQTVSFFRAVEVKMKGSSEALVQIWWDRETKSYLMHVPDQQVSGGSVHHQSTFDQNNEGRYFHVADIHSHGTGMSAFWSGTDNNDEKRISAERLFGVIGHVSKPMPMWKWRMSTPSGFIDLSITDIFEMPQGSFNFKVKSEDIFRSLGSDTTYKEGKVSLWCPVDPFGDVAVPEGWLEKVKGFSYGNSHGGYRMHGGPYSQIRQRELLKGFIYIDGNEFEIEETGTMKATGKKLVDRNKPSGVQ